MRNFLGLLMIMTVTVSTASADFLRAQAGAGLWMPSMTGTAQYKGNLAFDVEQDTGLDGNDGTYIWAYIKHPVPVIPNVRLEHTAYSETSTKVLTSPVQFKNRTFTASTETTLDLTQTDVILYYNFLDNLVWLTLDVGIDVKMYGGEVAIQNSLYNESVELDAVLPLGYLRVRGELPGTGLAIEADVKGISAGGASVTDARAKLDWTLISAGLALGVEAGYRTYSITLDDVSGVDTDVDLEMSGFFGGINVKF